MSKHLNLLKKQIKEKEEKDFEIEQDRVWNCLIKEKVAYTSYKDIMNIYSGDKDFIVDSGIARAHGVERYLLDNTDNYIFRIRYMK